MADAQSPNELYRASIVVTGTHYSMTTLAGRLLSSAPEFHLLHEPLNAQPTLSFDSASPECWYRYDRGERYTALREILTRAIAANGLTGEIGKRIRQVRSVRNALQFARYIQRKLPMRLARKPAVIKDPFLAFTAREMQAVDRLKIVLTVRHPCAFAESFARAGHDFAFADLLQPALLEALPEEAETIGRLAQTNAGKIEQAATLWRIVYGFAGRYYSQNPRTFVLHQHEMVASPMDTADRLFAFAGAEFRQPSQTFLQKSMGGSSSDFAQAGSYVRRDAAAILDKWKQRLTSEQIAFIASETGEIAAMYGYGPDAFSVRQATH